MKLNIILILILFDIDFLGVGLLFTDQNSSSSFSAAIKSAIEDLKKPV
jgi:hypothetical protein